MSDSEIEEATVPVRFDRLDLQDFSEDQAQILRAIVASRKGFLKSDGLDPTVVALLVQYEWIEWWLARACVTLTPIAAHALKLKMGAKGRWMSVSSKLSRCRSLEIPGQTTMTAAGINPDGNPDGWRPRNNGGISRPTILLGSSTIWNGPDAGRCQVCGSVEEIRTQAACLKCSRIAGEPIGWRPGGTVKAKGNKVG